MGSRAPALPEFARPPLVETALTVQFEKIEALRTVHAGLLWDRLRAEFPDLEHVEEHPTIEQAIELPGAGGFRSAGVRLELLGTHALPRLFFLTSDKTELVQFQADRLSHNWRKLGEGDRYPRYMQIRPTFERELRLLDGFFADEKLGSISPIQCEVSYINHILPSGDDRREIALGRVLKPWPAIFEGTAGCALEDASLTLRHELQDDSGNFLGRMIISAKPAIRRSDSRPLLVFELIARGRPIGNGISGAIGFIDRGRELLRRAFVEITTDEMHQVWGRS